MNIDREVNDSRPFVDVFQVDMSVSMTGVERAIEVYFKTHNRLPDTLFCGSDAYADGVKVAFAVKEGGTALLATQFAPHYQPRWWSVGQVLPDYGVGSVGS